MVALGIRRSSGSTGTSRQERVPKIKYARAIVVQDDQIWQVELPEQEARENLPEDARWRPMVTEFRKRGVLLGPVGGVFTLLILFMPILGLVNGLILGAAFGGPLGAVLGWMQGHRLAPTSFYTLRRTRIYPEDLVDEGTGEITVQEPPLWEYEPIRHTDLLGPRTFNPEVEQPAGVHLATAYSRKVEAPAVRRFFTSRMGGWQKLAFGSLIVMAICMVLVTFLLVMATQGG